MGSQKTGRSLVNRTIGRPIVRLSGSPGCAPSLMLSILYLNLTPDSFDGFLNRTSASNLTNWFSLNLTLAAASQGKYVACLFKSDSKVVPDSRNKPDSNEKYDSQVWNFCPIARIRNTARFKLKARFSQIARINVSGSDS